jgi:hypothetical protein
MNEDIGIPGRTDPASADPGGMADRRRLAPIRVGDATVFLEADDDVVIEGSGDIAPVSLDPREAFERAGDAMRECVRVFGERFATLASVVHPQVLEVEFTLSFEVEGKASIVPVLLTGKAKTSSGVKVTARWSDT